MKIVIPLALTVFLALIAWVGTEVLGLYALFGIVIPYVAVVSFVGGFVYRLIVWGRSAVPFRIPTTCGQQKSLPWVKQNKIDNPSSSAGVVGRMLLEVLVFRSLFRNTKTEKRGEAFGVGSAKWLWLGALVFHWSMLVIVLRHLRFFLDPVPAPLAAIEGMDSFLQVGLPLLYITDLLIVSALTFLFIRRVVVPRVRYLSLPNDYFPLFLLIGVVVAGIAMRYFLRVDITAVKEMAMGLVTLHPVVMDNVGSIFYVHLFLASVLVGYFPWSKLMHAGGIILSPTRNMANNTRMVRHVNPWNPEVEVHTYAEYEEEFKDKMVKVGLPLDAE
ncbi:sulfate reduction electron transfer complex DsrMKJOP subunit DsrM [Raoultibacter phocaeensis]|uniref:sulfate reduction electron transfer complex DsrMKJOP subunit DsrM n=1 Tax=Raoultibacter phocaeensis TaxID=2479841 RepID=UPI001118F990|nr:sulfate reduction electron transfer complex DsrMKJOP subunit DsrM [Raoultibacter phocaeensis]